ncbi:MAG: hypothetical protein PHE79_05265 [Eubacteriales bacterium]|nr:hypothetical protein [Eubacteriales bacterium]
MTSQNTNLSASSSNLQRVIDRLNADRGSLPDYDCEICKNKGFIFMIEDGREVAHRCKCVVTRNNIRNIRNIGIDLDECGFDKYKAKDEWQKNALKMAEDYARTLDGWFYVGGAVGCGKTLLCSSILKSQLHKGISAKYMAWRDEAGRLKASVNNNEEYLHLIEPLKMVGILYIDDFLKTAGVTKGDVNLAFEIINSRYTNKKPTIISCELSINDIISIDEALGSRIYERTKGNYAFIKGGERKNYRMR